MLMASSFYLLTMSKVEKLLLAYTLITDDIVSNKSFEENDLIQIRDKMDELIFQLQFWSSQDNHERFCYELKSHLNWILENYS